MGKRSSRQQVTVSVLMPFRPFMKSARSILDIIRITISDCMNIRLEVSSQVPPEGSVIERELWNIDSTKQVILNPSARP